MLRQSSSYTTDFNLRQIFKVIESRPNTFRKLKINCRNFVEAGSAITIDNDRSIQPPTAIWKRNREEDVKEKMH